ncbi:MAG: hypothetical protein ABI717_05695 [Actinomycetota bacterium]
MIAALLAAGVTAALLYRGGPRDDVSAYIEQVNESQRAFSTRYGSIDRTFREFRLSSEAAEKQLPQLQEAARTMTQVRLKIERLDAPKEAVTLRSRLLAFLRQEEAVANELVDVARYMPKLRDAEAPLAAASRRLRAALRGGASIEAQGAAVKRYAAELRAVAAKLDEVAAPPLLEPSRRSYAVQLREYASASEALQRGIRTNDQLAVDNAVRRMQQAASSPPGTFRAQQEAIKAYNERVKKIRALAVAVEKERQRLEREL